MVNGNEIFLLDIDEQAKNLILLLKKLLQEKSCTLGDGKYKVAESRDELTKIVLEIPKI